ncbi:MAG: hypothetical protein ACE141_11570 [Bryobacteraceae bacterium]
MWYLGSGTAAKVLAQDGNYYYQEYNLTANKNCDPASACPETPQWTLNTNQQVQLTGYSGTTTKIYSRAVGNCQWSTTLKVSIGGFQSDEQPIAVNSPAYVVHQEGLDSTEQWNGGYRSWVYWAVADSCSPAQAMIGLPFHETFGDFQEHPSVTLGWPDPQAEGAATFNYPSNMYIFRDGIGAWGNWIPAPVYTSANPPWQYETVLKWAPQSYRVGTATLGSGGTEVYSGTIKFYQDHGTTE